ncbi:BTH_I0359 family protein [Roseateles depolymerans]|uniref:Uncharacterized protein n=1 Tax=Roseateles depolymerans TaxID=76731 RepID=A0A0U2TXE0_9BURK|nr:DUF3567 domain-containing protein [Roseateles depolymerans]ALV04865.1 hypothetical protein RD2015_362 [Roseateles depolymerans]REG15123.1 uncharacterized protein DUF3567 [Roseateles depolymerans]
MHMLYDSPSYIVVQFDVPVSLSLSDPPHPDHPPLQRDGFEIVDKFSRKEIFIEGALAQQFQEGVEALIEQGPDVDDLDAFIAQYANMGQQPVVMH